MAADNKAEYREIIRSLVLPIPAKAELLAVDALVNYADEEGLTVNDLSTLVALHLRKWESDSTPSRFLKEIVTILLETSWSGKKHSIASCYFELYKIAIGKPDHLSHLSARYFISHLNLMVTLATEECMSASQIIRMLAARDERIQCSWKIVDGLLAKIRCKNSLELKAFKNLFAEDKIHADEYFADAPLNEAICRIGCTATLLGFDGDLKEMLEIMVVPGGTPIYSFLEILHYQTSLAEFFDHALTYCYEFNPRGEAVNWMHSQYPAVLITGKQPFLNIAKSVYQITEEWALPKENAREALALARILKGLEQLGFAGRKQLCAIIRYLIHRVIALHEGTEKWLPDSLDKKELGKIFSFVASSPSGSRGIIEQRVVDAVEWCRHQTEDGWKVSAIGDSVNATNRSGLKFGDCEFMHSEKMLLHAFEAHAGTLKDVYVEDHLDTLQYVSDRRRQVLEQQFDLDRLQCRITFLAHNINMCQFNSGDTRVINGIKFEIVFGTYQDSFRDITTVEGIEYAYRNHIADVMNNKCSLLTPQAARDALLKILK